MKAMNIVRLVNGTLLLIGLLYFKPLAYFIAAMMILAGLTNYCLMEKMLHKLGVKDSCGEACKNGRKAD